MGLVLILGIPHRFSVGTDGQGLVQPDGPFGHLAVIGVSLNARRYRGPKRVGQLGVGRVAGREGVGVGPLDHKDHRGPVAGLNDGLQSAEVLGASDGRGIGEKSNPVLHQRHRLCLDVASSRGALQHQVQTAVAEGNLAANAGVAGELFQMAIGHALRQQRVGRPRVCAGQCMAHVHQDL